MVLGEVWWEVVKMKKLIFTLVVLTVLFILTVGYVFAHGGSGTPGMGSNAGLYDQHNIEMHGSNEVHGNCGRMNRGGMNMMGGQYRMMYGGMWR